MILNDRCVEVVKVEEVEKQGKTKYEMIKSNIIERTNLHYESSKNNSTKPAS